MKNILDQIGEESLYEYTVYGGGYGKSFEHHLYEEYMKKIDKHLIIFENDYSEKELQDILDVLKKSIENGKDFYTNAKSYMKKKMEAYNKSIEEEIMY